MTLAGRRTGVNPLNFQQRVMVAVGVFIIAGMLLYPPWRSQRPELPRSENTVYSALGYSWIFSPPNGGRYDSDGQRLPVPSVTVDLVMLSLQCVAVLLLMGGATLLLNTDRRG